MIPAHELALRLATDLERCRFDESSEDRLQLGVERALGVMRIAFKREVCLTRADRIDFLVGAVGIECKTAGGLNAVIRQLARYAQRDEIEALLLVTTRSQLARVPATLNGKPIVVAATIGGLL